MSRPATFPAGHSPGVTPDLAGYPGKPALLADDVSTGDDLN